jgi:hypothetical protein
MALLTSKILVKEFRPSISSWTTPLNLTKYFSVEITRLQHKLATPPFNASRHQPSVLLFDKCEDPIPPEISPTPSLKEDSCIHSLQRILQLLQRIEVLRLRALLAAVVLQQFIRFANSETLLSLRTPCTAPMLNLHFYKNENNVNPPELSEIKL